MLSNKEGLSFPKINHFTIDAPTEVWARFYLGSPFFGVCFPALNHVALFLSNKRTIIKKRYNEDEVFDFGIVAFFRYGGNGAEGKG